MADKVKECKDCGKSLLREDLSNQGLCYNCAKERMVKYFDTMWSLARKRRVKCSTES